MSNVKLQTRRVHIPADQANPVEVDQSGTLFTVYETNRPFIVRDNRGSRVEIDRSCRVGPYPEGQAFASLIIEKDPRYADDELVVKLAIGNVQLNDGRTQISAVELGFPVYEAPSAIIGVPLAGGIIAGAGHVTLSGVPPSPTEKARQCVIVSNDDPSNKLTVEDGAGAACLRVYPFTSVRLEISGPVTIRNTNGSAVAASISEIWYTL